MSGYMHLKLTSAGGGEVVTLDTTFLKYLSGVGALKEICTKNVHNPACSCIADRLTMMSALFTVMEMYLTISKVNWAEGGGLVKYRVGNPHPSREPVLLWEIMDL